MAKEPDFRAELQAVADFENTDLPDNETFKIRRQPTLQQLKNIDDKLREKKDLHLCAYELAEVNRWLYEDKVDFAGKSMGELDQYWEAIREVASKEGRSEKPGFQEAVGMLSIDNNLRFDFAKGFKNLSNLGFQFDPGDEEALRTVMIAGGDADNHAKKFFNFSWSGPTCLSVMQSYPEWFHCNA